MNLIRSTYNIFLDALFPLSETERGLASLTPESAGSILPSAPLSPIKGARGIFAYKDERVAKLVWNVKYKRSAHTISIGGYALWKEFSIPRSGTPRSDLNAVDRKVRPWEAGPAAIIIPMPITAQRRRERGFNQCDLLVDEIKRLDVSNQFIIEKDLLVRVHHDSRQTLKGRQDRLESAKGIFAVNESALTRFASSPYKGGGQGPGDLRFIIIDDVITTGSTIKEAMDTLRLAGIENVSGLALAH